ncbi:hypothetical protein JOF56_009503 [Kibdelosporangium banguiense]|uniref:Uncharacterized protein n=1 Tax=Kibdelosporangium banguiense TaxID=1365924 RepID=A0ABS4TXI8_9PSEU|nr:hypothetical protein [Kibdelosporangium banguiense]
MASVEAACLPGWLLGGVPQGVSASHSTISLPQALGQRTDAVGRVEGACPGVVRRPVRVCQRREYGVARGGEFGRNALTHIRCARGMHEAGVREVVGGALVAAGQAVDEQIGFATAGDLAATRGDSLEHGKLASGEAQACWCGREHWSCSLCNKETRK